MGTLEDCAMGTSSWYRSLLFPKYFMSWMPVARFISRRCSSKARSTSPIVALARSYSASTPALGLMLPSFFACFSSKMVRKCWSNDVTASRGNRPPCAGVATRRRSTGDTTARSSNRPIAARTVSKPVSTSAKSLILRPL